MKTEIVNGHYLPSLLIRMMASGQWGPSNREVDFSSLPIQDKHDLALLDISEMIRNTEELRAQLDGGEGQLFGLINGGEPLPGLLDVNHAVVIAATYGQEALALDYSLSEEPRVVATHDEPARVRWVEVARNFEELVSILKLSAA
jgi:hypothetical protein